MPINFSCDRLSETVFRLQEHDECAKQEVHIYVILPPKHSHAYVIDTGTGENDTRLAIQKLIYETFELSARPFTIINTHNHFDHTGGNHYFIEHDPHTQILASDRNKDYTKDEIRIGSLDFGFRTRPYEVTRWLGDGQRIGLDDTGTEAHTQYFEIIHTPGHTPDSMCIYYSIDDRIFVGDLIYEHEPVLLLDKDASLQQLIDSCKRMHKWIQMFQTDHGTVRKLTLACGHVNDELSSDSFMELNKLLAAIQTGTVSATKRGWLFNLYVQGPFSLEQRRHVWLDYLFRPFQYIYLHFFL